MDIETIEVENDDDEQKVMDYLERLDCVSQTGYRGHSKFGFFTESGNWMMLPHRKLQEAKIERFEGELKSVTLVFDTKVQGTLDVKLRNDGMMTMKSNFPMDIGFKED